MPTTKNRTKGARLFGWFRVIIPFEVYKCRLCHALVEATGGMNALFCHIKAKHLLQWLIVERSTLPTRPKPPKAMAAKA